MNEPQNEHKSRTFTAIFLLKLKLEFCLFWDTRKCGYMWEHYTLLNINVFYSYNYYFLVNILLSRVTEESTVKKFLCILTGE